MKTKITCFTFFLLQSISALAKDCSQINVASGTFEWEPIAIKNPVTSQFEGIAFDTIREISERLGLTLDILELPFKRLLLSLETGHLDMALALYKNDERETKFLYSDPYFNNEARVFVKKGREFKFSKLEDLIGRSGVIPAGGSFGQKFDAFAKKRLDLYQLVNKPFKDTYHKLVLNERKDYFVADYLDGMTSIKRAGLEGQILPLEFPVDQNGVHFAFSRKSPCIHLLPKINEVVSQLKEEGFIQILSEQYE